MWNTIKQAYRDIEKTAKKVGVDIVSGLKYLINLFPEINKDISTVGELVEVLDPKTVGIVTALIELISVTEESVKIISEIANILDKIKITNIENDAIIIKKDIENLIQHTTKFTVIWEAQKNSANKILKEVSKNTIEKINTKSGDI